MKKDIIVPLVVGTIICVGFLIFGGYALVEPSEAQADTTSTTVTLDVTEEISLTVTDAAIAMKPDITMSQESAVTSTDWVVTTNAEAGYTLKLTAATTTCATTGGKALCCASTIEGFADVSTTTPNGWSTSSDTYIFGYSGYGDDASTTVWGDDTNCGTAGAGGLSTNLNYAGFATTTGGAPIFAESDSKTGESGATTTMCVAAEQGDDVYAPNGSYSATITGTATAN